MRETSKAKNRWPSAIFPPDISEELARSKKYMGMRRKKDELKALEERLRREEEPLVKALREAGVNVKSVWDLVNMREPYPAALPVLVEHLSRSYHPITLEGIARALAARDPFTIERAWAVGLDLYLEITPEQIIEEPDMRRLQDGLVAMLSVLYTRERLPQVLELIRDPRQAQEFVEELVKNKKYAEVRRKENERLKAFEEESRHDEEPLVKALREVGVSVNSVWDLVNTTEPYPAALPVLLEHLSRSYHPVTLEGIARALAVRDPFTIEHAWPVGLDLYLKITRKQIVEEPDMLRLQGGLAAMLSVLYTEDRLLQVFELIKDPRNGDSRGFFIYGLGEFRKNPKVKEFLESLHNDRYWGELARKASKGR